MNRKSFLKSKSVLILILILAAVLLSGCSGQALDKLWLKSEGWSRAVLLGETAMPAPMEPALDAEGTVYGILFPRSEEDRDAYHPHVIRLGPDGQTRTRIPLDFNIPQPREARLILTDKGMDLFWIDSNQLKMVQLDEDGNNVSEIQILSTEKRVDHLEVLQLDGIYHIWYSGSRDNPGVYSLRGEIGSLEKSVIDPEGSQVNLFLDAEKQIHASWGRYPLIYGDLQFYYLQNAGQGLEGNQPVVVYSRGISPSIKVEGPVLGIDQEVGYLIWSELIVSGLEAGLRNTYYRYFPIGEPDAIRPSMSMRVPIVSNLPASDFEYGAFQTGERVYLSSGIPSSSAIENVEILDGQYSEIPIVFRSRSEFKWRDFRSQANIAYFSDGLLTTYQPLSYTSAESYYPAVVEDANLNLYVTWLEKGESTYRVYLTTTEPEKKNQLDLVSMEDYLYLTAEGVFGILAGAVLSPFAAAVWGGLGLIGFLINLIFSRINNLAAKKFGEIASMAAGVGIFWYMKLATLPGLKTWDYVPFSAWIPRIPEWLQQPLVYGVPILIALIAFSVAYFKTYGKSSGSPINFHFLYSAVDALLSCAVYGVLIYGSF